MPIFEYSCSDCAHLFEKVQQSTVDQDPTCPKCGSSDVRKELSSFAPQTSSSCSCYSGG